MTSSMLRRQLKNLVQNYSEAEVKVREATSNDPWGPSSSQMADISDLTYNVVACNEIMTMLWKRLKDDKNWRHIHKSLTLLEYLLKTGDDRVLLKMKDNIYIVKALTEYRFIEKDGKDQGVNVREKAKVVLVLMEDDEKLKEEREFARKTREKTSKGSAASSSDAIKDPNYKPCYVPGAMGLPSLDNIPSVADLTASFTARKEERLRQEADKKESERRAKMSEDELKWEDAGKGNGVKEDVWGEDKEEVKTDPWGASKEPKEATDPWGTPTTPDTDETAASSDPWGGAVKTDEDPFAAPKTDEDPFAAPKTDEDPFAAPKTDEDPFAASKTDEDPFAAPKNGEDAFAASVDDPFNAPKDKEDPFSAPKEKPDPFSSSHSDPFNASKDDPFTPKDDPFNTPKDDPFNTPKDDPFSTPKDDPFNTPKDDPFTAPASTRPKEDPFAVPASTKDDPFTAPITPPKKDPFSALTKTAQDDPFAAPPTPPKTDPFFSPLKDDPFTAPTTPPKDDPFTAPTTPPKDDPFSAPTTPPKDDPFSAPTTPPKNDPFSAPTTPPKDDPFTAPTTPPMDDPFTAPTTPPKDDPFTAPTTPPKGDPFGVPSSPPKDGASDPFSAPPVSSPQSSKDAWEAPASSLPDPWETPVALKETKVGDPWGDGTSASLPVDNSDPFGDASKPDNDPWGAPAAAPLSTDDAWGSSAPPSDTSPSNDPFGDGASKTSDPWGAPSNATSNGTGKRTRQEEEMYKKTASFLGSAGASLVDFDDLLSLNPKPKQHPLTNTFAAQTQASGMFKSGPVVRSGGFAGVSLPEVSVLPGSPFGSTIAPSCGAQSPMFRAAKPSTEPPLFQLPWHTMVGSQSGLTMLQAAQMPPPCSATGLIQPVSFGGGPQMGLNMSPPCERVVQSGFSMGNPVANSFLLGTGMGQSSFFGENQQAGVAQLGGSTSQSGGGVPMQLQLVSNSSLGGTVNKNTNPFLF